KWMPPTAAPGTSLFCNASGDAVQCSGHACDPSSHAGHIGNPGLKNIALCQKQNYRNATKQCDKTSPQGAPASSFMFPFFDLGWSLDRADKKCKILVHNLTGLIFDQAFP